MAPASSKIKYPARYNGPSFSSDSEVTGRLALISILNALGKIADLVESPRSRSHAKIDEECKRRFCNAIVVGANGFTDQFNAAAKIAKNRPRSSDHSYTDLFTDGAPRALAGYRNRIVADLENPLKDLIQGKRSHHGMIDLEPYEATLANLLSKIRRELQSWLADYIRFQVSAAPQYPGPSHYQPEPTRPPVRNRPRRKRRRSRERGKSKRSRSSMCLVM